MATVIQIPTDPISRHGNKKLISTFEESPAPLCPPGHVAVYMGDDVPRHRALEIMNGWMRLWGALRDKHLINLNQPTNGRIHAGNNINRLTEADRRITWEDNLFFTSNDILIGISVESQGRGAVNQLQSNFQMLRDWASENYFK